MAKAMSDEKSVRPGAQGIADAARAAAVSPGLPPVHLWDPPFCGDLDMRIARDGTWFYQGTPIGRPALARLFSTILKREGDRFYLVTPVEKVGITVDDAPFVAVDFQVKAPGPEQQVIFETNMGDRVSAGPDHPIRVAYPDQSGEPAPYVTVRNGLDARIDRKSFYRLVDIGSHERQGGTTWFGVRAGGGFFPFIRSAEL